MENLRLTELATQLRQGSLSVSEFVQLVSAGPTVDLDVAQVDLDRQRRCGFPEVVYGQGKPPEALLAITQALYERCGEAFATRIEAEQAALLTQQFPTGIYNKLGRTFRVPKESNGASAPQGNVTIVTAGTSDLPIAEEARETAVWMGTRVTMVHDVGVAGPHRLPAQLDKLVDADAVVVIAGMEGALPSVVGGYVRCPVIGVPTSVGYGASLGGISALLGMLNSCASNVTVVNIDSGFKGAYVAGLIAQNAAKLRSQNT